MSRLSRSFPAQLRQFEQVRALIDEFGESAGVAREDRHKLTLIVEELFTNTVTHGFQGDHDSLIQVALERIENRVLLTYEDAAPEHNSIAEGLRVDIEATVRQRQVGGIGVAMALGLTRDQAHAFVNGRNRVTMTYVLRNSGDGT